MQLNFRSQGAGFPLLILHGLFGSLDNWQTIARELATRFHVFTLDLRNHGASPHSDEFTLELMGDDLLEFLDRQQLPAVHLLGHSLGGKVAMQFALTHPARVTRLMVADISPRAYSPRHEAVFDALLALDLIRLRSRGEVVDQLAKSVPDKTTCQFLAKSLKQDAAGRLSWKMNLPSLARNRAQVDFGLDPNLRFDRPTVFLRGSQSDYLTGQDEPLIKRMFPQSKLVTIAGAGHWIHAEKPSEFAQSVIYSLS